MKNVWIAFRTMPTALIVIGIAALAYLVAKILIFDSMPEISHHAYEFGRLVQSLLEATIAAIVFFAFSFQLPAVIEQQRVGPAIFALVDTTVGRVIGAFSRAYRERPGHPVPEMLPLGEITLELVSDVFSDINPNIECQSMLDLQTGKHARWIRTFIILDEQCQELIAQIWRYGRYLDCEVAALLSEIESSSYSQMLKHIGIGGALMSNPNLSFLAGSYFEIFGSAMRLAKCAKKMRKRYGIV